jgi:GntR family transcriptional regulator, arabinose operon transcriptional repressor
MSKKRDLKTEIRRDFIASKQAQIGTKIPSVRKMATKYEVSVPTICKAIEVLSDQGWLNKKQGSGVYISKLDNAKPKKETLRLGYIASSLHGSLTQCTLDGIEYLANRNSYILEVAKSNWDVEKEKSLIYEMKDRGVQGVVLYPTSARANHPEYLATEFQDFPIVIVDLYSPKMQRSHVVFDNYTAGREMTHYLLGKDRRNIVFIHPDNNRFYPSIDNRIAGFEAALAESGLTTNSQTIAYKTGACSDAKEFLEKVKEIVISKPDTNAIMVTCDLHAAMAIQQLRALDKKIPDDIMVVGFDNLPLGQTEFWPTTSPNFIQMGERAAEILVNEIKNGKETNRELFLSCPILTQPNKTFTISNWVGGYSSHKSPVGFV